MEVCNAGTQTNCATEDSDVVLSVSVQFSADSFQLQYVIPTKEESHLIDYDILRLRCAALRTYPVPNTTENCDCDCLLKSHIT